MPNIDLQYSRARRLKRLIVSLVAVAALPAHAYYSQWVKIGDVGTTFEIYHPFAADLNRDGKSDLIYRTSAKEIRMLLTGSTSRILVYSSDSLSDMTMADVTGDGNADVIVSDLLAHTISVLPSNGDGTFASPIVTTLSFSAPIRIAPVDINGDGKIDLAVQSYSASLIAICVGDGSGHFAEESYASTTMIVSQMVAGDVDHDGHADLVMASTNPVALTVYYGNGDGTLASPSAVTAAAERAQSLVLGDLDNDGDLEIVTLELAANTVTIIKNLGGRLFAAPASYDLVYPALLTGSDPKNASDVVVGDVTDDGIPDVIVTLKYIRAVATLPGLGDASLGPVGYSSTTSVSWPQFACLADFDGNGQPDLAVSSGISGRTEYMVNKHGESSTTITPRYPTISAGQKAVFTVNIHVGEGLYVPYGYSSPSVSGTITLREGATVVASQALNDYIATVEVAGLTSGAHTITATYEGSSDYKPSNVSTDQAVVDDQLVMTLTSDAPAEGIEYGQLVRFSTAIAGSGPFPGDVTVVVDGLESHYGGGGQPWNFGEPSLELGTHTLYTRYEGSATQPPATSNAVTVRVVRKAQSTTAISAPATRFECEGLQVSANVSPHFGGSPQGTIRLYDQNTLLGTMTLFSAPYLDVGALSVGVHYLHAYYGGDTHFEPSESPTLRVTVLPAGTFTLNASADSGQVALNAYYASAPAGTHYDVRKRVNTGPWTTVISVFPPYASQPSYVDTAPANGSIVSYRFDAIDSNYNIIASSSTDVVIGTQFTEDPLSFNTFVKAVHLSEIVTAANALRSLAGLPAVQLTEAGTGNLIRASHITALQTAINEGRAALGITQVTFSSDATSGSLIRMRHVQELRDALH